VPQTWVEEVKRGRPRDGRFVPARIMMRTTMRAMELKREPAELKRASHFVGMEERIAWRNMMRTVRR
jgi:hypothetical protein